MARTPYTLNTYTGGAIPASLTTGIGTSDTSLILAGPFTGWTGLGSGGGFFLVLDYGVTIAEEKVYVPTQSINWTLGTVTLTSVVRGVDTSVTAAHSIGATVRPVLTAVDLQEANTLVSQSLGQIAANGDLLVGSAANTLTKIASGAAGTILTSAGVAATPTWNSSFPAANLSAGALPQTVTASRIWSAADTTTVLTVSGYNNYLILARAQYTQPSSGMIAGQVLVSAIVNSTTTQLASSYLTATAGINAEITGFTFLAATTASYTVQLSTSGPGTASARSIIVIGIN